MVSCRLVDCDESCSHCNSGVDHYLVVRKHVPPKMSDKGKGKDKPKRELSSDSKKHLGQDWHEWVMVLIPTPDCEQVWFLGANNKSPSIVQIPQSTLPVSACGVYVSACGVYEIGVSREILAARGIICVYAGRAIHNHSRGNNMRLRLGRYIKSGFDLGNELRYFLVRGFSVHVRWCLFPPLEPTEKAELALLGTYDYAFNQQHNGKDRAPQEVLYDDSQTLRAKLAELTNEKDPDEESEDEVDDDDDDEEGYFRLCESFERLSLTQKMKFRDFLETKEISPSPK